MSSTAAQYLDWVLSSTVFGSILCVSGVVGIEVETSLMGDDISPSVVSCNGSVTMLSLVVTAGVGSSVSLVFILLLFFCMCSGVSLVSIVLISVRGRGDLSFCSC